MWPGQFEMVQALMWRNLNYMMMNSTHSTSEPWTRCVFV